VSVDYPEKNFPSEISSGGILCFSFVFSLVMIMNTVAQVCPQIVLPV
jgi:hypothetical protein